MPETLPSSITTPPRALLVAVPMRDADDAQVESSLAEMRRLLAGLGIDVVHVAIQRRDDRGLTLGAGKLRELARLTGGPGTISRGPPTQARSEPEDVHDGPDPIADVVVFDAELSPSEQRRLAIAFGVEVVDRFGTILRVFERRARTRAAKLEVQIARAEYDLARSRETSAQDDREGGGGRGERGNANAELARQRHHRRVAAMRRELDAAKEVRDRTRARRRDVPSVALVGYTNAGKSSLMRAMTGSDVYVDDKLFATLDTTVRTLEGSSPRILVSDTVGFLENLPHELIASFRSTLDEANDAFLVLIVLDASDPRIEAHLRVTTETLASLEQPVPRKLVLNKIDRVADSAREALRIRFPDALLVSAFDPSDVAAVREAVVRARQADLTEVTLHIPYSRGDLLGEAHAHTHVVREAYEDAGIAVTLRAAPNVLSRLQRSLARVGGIR